MKHPALVTLERAQACCICGTPFEPTTTGVLSATHLVVVEIGGEMYGFPVCSAWCAYKLGHRTAPFHRMKNVN